MAMGRIQIAAAAVTAFFAALLIIRLSLGFGIDEAASWLLTSHHQIPHNSSSARPDDFEDGTRYLLGVGKADITGQGSNYRDTQSVC